MNLNMSTIPKEVQFLIALLKEKRDMEKLQQWSKEINWDAFIEYSNHHRIYPIVYLTLKQMEEQIVPVSVMEYLTIQYKKNTLKMLQFSAVTEQICKMFSEKKIPVILLKGPALAHQLYGDISHRTSSDLDLLIPIEKLEDTEKLLVEQGYKKNDYIKTVLNDWKWRHHHVTYMHPQQQIKIEIHWRLHPGPGKEPSFHELWLRRSNSSSTNFPVYLLGKEDLLLYLMTHGARHGWSRLRWLVDMKYIFMKDVDWSKVKKLAAKYQYQRSLYQGIYLAANVLGARLTMKSRRLIRNNHAKKLANQAIFYLEKKVNLHANPVPEDVAHYHKQHLFALMSLQQKLIFMLSFFYPYPEDTETLPLPRTLHFLYFPLRPFLWAWRKTRKHAIS